MNDIHRKLYILRMLHNYTQAYIAGKLDISPTAYISIEQNASNITVKRLANILDIYNVTLLDFFSFSENDLQGVLRKGSVNSDINTIAFRMVSSKMEALNRLLFQLLEQSIEKK